jgi:hypothetical protein
MGCPVLMEQTDKYLFDTVGQPDQDTGGIDFLIRPGYI